MVELLTLVWLFHTSQPPESTLTPQTPQAEFKAPANPTNGFTLKLAVNLGRFDGEKTLLEVPQLLSVRLRQHDPHDRNRQNYPAYPMPDGSVPVLEASLALRSLAHPEWTNMTLGIPLALLKRPHGEHAVVLSFAGAHWKLYVDGELLDQDFPYGDPPWRDRHPWTIDPAVVKQAALYFPAIRPEPQRAPRPQTSPGIQYWVPPGHNNWVGDVVTCFHQGRYHVFYLFDRRHHQSKFGCGAHYFEHLSTPDFKTWTEHEAATPLEEQWECIGTGTPFVYDGKLCLSYGLHTTRVYPREQTALPAQWESLNQHGRTAAFPRATTRGFPAGSTYAVSADGVTHFRKSGILFHPCENPSVYTDPDGQLRMIANYGSRGIWASDRIDGGWHCLSPEFPPGGDCTFFFRWGRFDYILGGFTSLWSKPADAPLSAYTDVVRQGRDFYDGVAVPCITEIPYGRFLMAGWIPVRGWGGCLVIRELLQHGDGRIDTRWMPEIMPRIGKPTTPAVKAGEALQIPAARDSFLLQFEVQPAQARQGRLGVVFLPEHGEQAACELQLGLKEATAQWGPGFLNRFADREKSLREGGTASAVENLLGLEAPFQVRVLVKGTAKLGGSLVDAEIAGQRTLISYRPDLTVRKLLFRAEGVALKNVQIAPLL